MDIEMFDRELRFCFMFLDLVSSSQYAFDRVIQILFMETIFGLHDLEVQILKIIFLMFSFI